jgi:hypothetical protein
MLFAAREVIRENVAGRRVQRDQARLAELGASDRQHRVPEIEVPQLEVARFAEAQACDTQEPEQTMISPGPQSTTARQRERRA